MLGTIGHRESERALQLGHLYSGEEALQVGLIDQLLPPEQMEEAVSKWHFMIDCFFMEKH